nr:deoxyribodipyrimidine photo-lyase [Demequina lutea]
MRHDARLSDNPALLAAQSAGAALPVFPWSPPLTLWSGRSRARRTEIAPIAARRGKA